MSEPKAPVKTPKEALTDILESIALEEIALAHLINAEAEKVQKALSTSCSAADLITIDKSVITVLQNIIKKEILLQFKLEQVCECRISKDHGGWCD